VARTGIIGKSDENENPQKIYMYCKANLTYDEVIEMINIAITKLSSKGQIVIPSEMRDNFSEGEKLVIIKNGEHLILKKVSDLGKNFREDIAFAKKTEEAWQSYERGEFVSQPADKFLEELEKC
jgi:AbrB family looped-hinge helix DNA binding protein